ncbi:MAG: penicillin-binding protein 2 [Armatimonadia bacterium]
MESLRLSRKRANAFVAALAACSLLLVGRLSYIQVVRPDHYLARAAAPAGSTKEIRGPRGRILDCMYRVLAESVTASTVSLSPDDLRKWAAKVSKCRVDELPPEQLPQNPAIRRAATAISATLGLPYDEVMGRICQGGKYAPLVARIDTTRAEDLKHLKIPGVFFETTERREYPFGPLASGVLGFCNAEQQPTDGVERWYRQIMDGKCVTAADRYDVTGRRILGPGMGTRPTPTPGNDLILTVHLGVQQLVEKELDECVALRHPVGANVVVMSAHDGSVLAMSCRPNFDPNEISKARGHRAPISEAALVNRPVARAMDPGSSFKLLTIAAALDAGVIDENSTFYCAGTAMVGGRPLKCWGQWAGRGHGALTPGGILAQSCNLCAAQVAKRLGAERFCAFLKRCGIGELPEAGLSGEVAGVLRDPAKMRERDLACLGFGQSVQVSDLQLTAALCAIMNGGIMYQPHIAAGYVNPVTGESYVMQPRALRRVCSPQTSAIMRRLARYVVDGGTGKAAAIPGFAVGGKTATAQIFDNENHRWMDGPRDYVMGFVLTAPVDRQPDFVISVSVERPQTGDHGSDVAAPIARRIAEYLLTQPGLFPKWDAAPPSKNTTDDKGQPA